MFSYAYKEIGMIVLIIATVNSVFSSNFGYEYSSVFMCELNFLAEAIQIILTKLPTYRAKDCIVCKIMVHI